MKDQRSAARPHSPVPQDRSDSRGPGVEPVVRRADQVRPEASGSDSPRGDPPRADSPAFEAAQSGAGADAAGAVGAAGGARADTTLRSGEQGAGPKVVYHFTSGFGQPFPAGFHPYGEAALASFRPFVPPDGLDRLARRLGRGPVAVLRGPAGAGKQATALRLLAELGARQFYTVDPEARFPILDLRPVPAGSGLVLADLSEEAAARLRRHDLDRIGPTLEARDSWLVITLDDSADWADPELVELTVALPAGPPARAVVEAHLRERIGDPQATRARRLLGHPALASQLEALPPDLHLADAAALGRLLARCEDDPDAAAERFGLLTRPRPERELVGWFAALSDAATRFFALALTFAEGEPVATVAAIADSLDLAFRRGAGEPAWADFAQPGSSPLPGSSPQPDDASASVPLGRPAWARSSISATAQSRSGYGVDPFRAGRAGRLRDIRALAGPRIVRTRLGSVQGQGAEFVEPGYADRLLRHVWTEYRLLRPALLTLIAELGTHPSTPVRRRAVAAVGALARETGGFEQLLAAVVEPWARADDPVRNEAAAQALRAAEEDAGLSGPVWALIHEWARSRNPGLLSTAAWALGRRLGPAESGRVAAALLTELAEEECEAVVDAICHAVTATVDTSGDAEVGAVAMAVFDLLGQWVRTSHWRVRRAAELAVFTMAGRLVRYGDPHSSALNPPRPTECGGETPWPGLLWLAERSPELGRSAGRLFAAALASAECGPAARRLLDRWAVQAEPFRERREALARLLFTAAGHAKAHRILARRAAAWTSEGSGTAAPCTGALVTSLLNIS